MGATRRIEGVGRPACLPCSADLLCRLGFGLVSFCISALHGHPPTPASLSAQASLLFLLSLLTPGQTDGRKRMHACMDETEFWGDFAWTCLVEAGIWFATTTTTTLVIFLEGRFGLGLANTTMDGRRCTLFWRGRRLGSNHEGQQHIDGEMFEGGITAIERLERKSGAEYPPFFPVHSFFSVFPA